MNKNNFQIVITNQLDSNQEPNLVIQKLADLFKIDTAKAALLLSHPRTVIKDNLDETTAKKYYLAISQTGAHCEIINKRPATELPGIIEPAKPSPNTTQHRDPTSVPDTRLKTSDAALSLVERDEKNQKATAAKLETLKHTSSETLCPECGTIRGSVDDICLHCGYDPDIDHKEDDGRNKKKWMVLGAAAFVIVVVTLVASFPFYQKKIAAQKLEANFQPAFAVRNQVTEFIERTNFFPNQNLDANLPENISTDTIASIEISENATITVTMKPAAAGGMTDQTLILVPKSYQGKIVWNCMQGSLISEYRPAICRNQNQD